MNKYKISSLFLILLIVTVVFAGCTSEMPYDENRVSLEIGFNENLGTVEVEGDEIEPGEEFIFEQGTEVTLEAIPDEGAEFERWENIDETDEEITIVMDEDLSVIAEFTATAEVDVTVEHELDFEPIDDYLDRLEEDARAEELYIELIREDDTTHTFTVNVDEEFEEKYETGITVEEEATYDMNVELRGSFVEEDTETAMQSEEPKAFYAGEKEEVEITPGAGEMETIDVNIRPQTAESLTVKMTSPDDALEELEELKLEHASYHEDDSHLARRKAVKDYVGDADEGEVKFEDGEIYNDEEFEMKPGRWDVSLVFDEHSQLEVEEDIILLPREEKRIDLVVYWEEGDLVVELAWELPPSAPENVEAETTEDGIQVSWDSVEEAESYTVVRREPEGNDYWQPIAEGVEDTEYIDEDAMPGVIYEYAVVAVNEYGLTSDYSEPTEEIILEE